MGRKWSTTPAAEKRIKARLAAMEIDYSNPWRLWDHLLEAMAPENYAHPKEAAESLVERWIREGEMPVLCAGVFGLLCYERKQLRDAGRDLMDGIRAFGRLKL